MSLRGPFSTFLGNLSGEINPKSIAYMPKESAYEILKQRTGQDFGYDADKWKEWIKAHKEELAGAKHEKL